MLNDDLYQRLTRACRVGLAAGGLAGGKVRVTRAGNPLQGTYVRDPTTGKIRLKVVQEGESYGVCCPSCGDTRYRLSISHRWGVRDPQTGTGNYWLIRCYNEECQSKDDFIPNLLRRIDSFHTRFATPGRVAEVQTTDFTEKQVIELPGPSIPAHRLSDDHPGSLFLKSRGFDPRIAGTKWQISWCTDSTMRFARDRLVFPFFENNELVGWQARYVDPDGSGDCKDLFMCGDFQCNYHWRNLDAHKPKTCPQCLTGDARRVMKWFTCPGMRAGSTFYNYDQARGWPFIVLCEGPMDVIRLGTPKTMAEPGPGMAVFGHHLSDNQLNKISQYPPWQTGNVYLCFDDDVWTNPRESSRMVNTVSRIGAAIRGQVIPVFLPEDKDPGDCSHKELWRHIRESSLSSDVTPTF